MPRLLFSSFHSLQDPASGAAISAGVLLEMLAERGWEVRGLCGPLADGAGAGRPPDTGAPAEFHEGGVSFDLGRTSLGTVPVVGYRPANPGEPTAAEVSVFRGLHERTLDRWRPDVLLTYGGGFVGRSLIDAARTRGIRTAFWLRNTAYRTPRLFATCDVVIVPSRFAARFYRRRLGMRCEAIPSPIRWNRVRCGPDADRRFVTFVNPHPSKGAAVFARIAAELGRRRPDVPLLVVEGRAVLGDLARYGADLTAANLSRMRNTPDPRHFYRATRVLLAPALVGETFGRTAAEALINGIPVLASDRGGLPDTVGDGGLILPLPRELTPATRVAPPASVVEPWIVAILRLWDDPAYHTGMSRRASAASARFAEGPVGDRHDALFRSLLR